MQSSNHGVRGNKKIAYPHAGSNSPLASSSFFSSQNRNMDYVTQSGISERTGISKNDLPKFALKELLDNAIDFIERQEPLSRKEKSNNDRITVSFVINSSEGQDCLILKVRNCIRDNSNSNQNSFNKEKLEQIFDFNKYHSTKRNLFTVSRGALGDAFKEILASTYVLARDIGRESQIEPLTITTPGARYEINLEVDRINQTVSSKISEFSANKDKHLDNGEEQGMKTNFTEIEVHFQQKSTVEAMECLNALHAYVIEYAFINLHVSFEIRIESPDIAKVLKCPQSLYLPSHYEEGCNVASNTSIYYYTFSEFQNFIEGITLENNSLLAYDLIRLKFREGTALRKTGLFSSLTVANLKLNQNDEARSVYNALKDAMCPPVVDTNASKKKLLSLPFNMSKGDRKEAFRNRIQSCGIEVQGIKYDYIVGYHSSFEGDQRFPFIFEIAVVQCSKELIRKLWLIESLNSSLPFSEYLIFSSSQNIFTWDVKGSEKVNEENSIYSMLRKYGYSHNEYECKKPYNIVIVNLISPKITYNDYSKSRINLGPFAEAIAQTVYKVAAFSSDLDKEGGGSNKLSIIDLERKLLYGRYQQIKIDPGKKDTDRWTQSTVFYYLRPILNILGSTTRKTIQGHYIKAICKELGITRAELGIVAADRAQIYFRGRWEDVGIDELDTLMHYGVDVLIIEKEGVAQALSHYADEYGIALINTRGFLTENVSILSNLAKKTDGNVAILTDYDISGMLIAIKAPKDVPRIGIDFETLKYLEIENSSLSELEENYEPSESHLKAVENYVEYALIDGSSEDSFGLTTNIQYLRHKRIEIDSVIKYVGISRFWTFIIDRLKNEFPIKNYNRAINIPSNVIPEPLEKLTKIVNREVTKILQPCIVDKKKGLENYDGFLPIKEYENNIRKEFKNIVANKHNILTPLLDDILSVVNKYSLED
ncbi:MAG TPA: hypothetical protein VFY68_07575 [Nitrososphaeraceae archaeon]|nr:hypothetical protein [Nitrososphaeraceae archaeon]